MSTKRTSDRKDQAVYLGAAILAMSMLQIHLEVKKHIEDCSIKSAWVVKILSGVAIMVLGELIMKGFSLFQLVSASHVAN